MNHAVGDEIDIECQKFVVSSVRYLIDLFKIYVRMKKHVE